MGTVGLFVDDPSVAVVYFLVTVDLMLSNLPTPYLQFWVPNWYHFQCRWDGLLDRKWLLYVSKIIG